MFFAMTAKQLIAHIKSLSAEERAEVIDFIKALDDATPGGDIRYADDETFQAALHRVMEEDAALLKKLAE